MHSIDLCAGTWGNLYDMKVFFFFFRCSLYRFNSCSGMILDRILAFLDLSTFSHFSVIYLHEFEAHDFSKLINLVKCGYRKYTIFILWSLFFSFFFRSTIQIIYKRLDNLLSNDTFIYKCMYIVRYVIFF